MSITASVLGIDPSLTATGLALPDGSTKTIKYTPRSLMGDIRLKVIYEELLREIEIHSVTHAIIEDLPAHAKSAGITGKAQGVVRLACLMSNVPFVTVVPSSVKKFATGKGTADKPDMRMELYKRTGVDQKDDNQVDAFWMREMVLNYFGLGSIDLPKANLEGLTKIQWTEEFVQNRAS